MCTVLFMNIKPEWNKTIAPSYREMLKSILLHRGRDVFSIVDVNKNENLFHTVKSNVYSNVDECLNYIENIEGRRFLAIFCRATPETETVGIPKQPYSYVDRYDGNHLLLHNGIYSNAKQDEYDSEKLFKLLIDKSDKFVDELMYNSSFLLMDADVGRKIVVYKGQFEYGVCNTKYFQIIGTLPDRYFHENVPPYSKVFYRYNYQTGMYAMSETYSINGVYQEYDNLIKYDKTEFYMPVVSNIGALYSSGMDIFVSVNYLLDTLECVKTLTLFNVDYGQHASAAEKEYTIKAAEYFKKRYNVNVNVKNLNVKFLYDQSNLIKGSVTDRDDPHREAESDSNYVPMRNLQLISSIAPLCESMNIHGLVIGLNLSEGMTYCDNATSFYYNLVEVLQCCGKRGYSLNLLAPLIHMTKTDIIRLADERGYDLNYSWSCYYPIKTTYGYKPCGECGSCLLRQKAIERVRGLHPRAKEK